MPNNHKTWTVQTNDSLDSAVTEKAVHFLDSFLSPEAERIWSLGHFQWKLGEANPAGCGFMTVAVYDDEVIGIATVTRKRMWDGQKELPAAEIGDCYSHPDFRRESHAALPYPSADNPDEYLSRSVFGRLVTETMERVHEAGLLLVYATANGNSMPGFVKRLNFFHYKVHTNQYFVRPGSVGIVKKIPPLRPLHPLLHFLDVIFSRGMNRVTSGFGRLQAEELLLVGNEIDELWLRVRASEPFGSIRDSEYFRHRFLDNPLARYRIWAIRQAGIMHGIFVTRTMSQPGGGVACFLADWLLDSACKGLFRFAVSHMAAHLRGKDTNLFAFWANRDWARKQGLKRLGCWGREKAPIIFHSNAVSRAMADQDTQLHFTLATSDNI